MSKEIKAKRRNMTPAEQRDYASMMQFKFLEYFAQASGLSCKDIVFHGGTSLRCAWRSPRFSEDLDFLVSEEASERIETLVKRAIKRVKEYLVMTDPGVKLNLKDKTKEARNLIHFEVVLEKENLHRSSMVKLEFWKVPNNYLDQYASKMIQAYDPKDLHLKMDAIIPVADIATIFCDKLVALSTRPYLKWRDLFDIWWIRTQNPEKPEARLGGEELRDKYLHHLSGYKTRDGLPPAQALALFLEHDTEELVQKAVTDLKEFLPQPVWEHYFPNTIREMVETVKTEVKGMIELLSDVSTRDPALPSAGENETEHDKEIPACVGF